MATPEPWENATPIYGIRYPKPTAPAYQLPTSFQHTGLDVEAALSAASFPPVQSAAIMVAPTQAARDSYWGIPANTSEQLALQNRGATTLRTDLGITERYFAAAPPLRPVAGWYRAGAPTVGTFSYGAFYKAHPTWGGVNVERDPTSRRVHMFGSITTAQTVTFAGGTEYTIGAIPVGFRPAVAVFRPVAITPLGLNTAWFTVQTNGNCTFAVSVGYTAATDGMVWGLDFWFDAPS